MPGIGLASGHIADVDAPAHLGVGGIVSRGVQGAVVKGDGVADLDRLGPGLAVPGDVGYGLALAVAGVAPWNGTVAMAAGDKGEASIFLVGVDEGDPDREDAQLGTDFAAVVETVLVPGKGGARVVGDFGADPVVAVGRQLRAEKVHG